MSMTKKPPDFLKPKTTYADTLRFTPYAWSKFLYMQKRGNTEIAGYCITSTIDPLLVTNFKLIKQKCTGVSFDLDQKDSADFMGTMLDAGLMPWQFQRILAHSHPGISPNPSGTDEENFKKVFTHPDWAIMLIVAENGAIYCRIKFNVGPGGTQMLKVEVDFRQEFQASNHDAWKKEYDANVDKLKFSMTIKDGAVSHNYDPFIVNKSDDLDDPIWCNEEDLDCHWDCFGNALYFNNNNYVWYAYDPINKQWFVEEGEDNRVEINKPDQLWGNQVIAWVEKYYDERQPAMEK